MKTVIKEKIYAVEGFMKSIKFLSALRPLDKNENERHLDKDKLPIGMTCYFLNALIFEILLKIFSELRTNKSCNKTHNLENIYESLSEEDKEFIKYEYKDLKENLENTIHQTEKGRKANMIFCDLQESLQINKNIVTDFKYDMKVNQKNTAFNRLIINDTHIYIIPHKLQEKFFNKLLKRAQEKFDNKEW